jgi:hypothetical protein
MEQSLSVESLSSSHWTLVAVLVTEELELVVVLA